MIDTPQFIETEATPIAFIPITVPRSEIGKVMGPGISELMRTVGSQGAAPVGPWFCHHPRIDPAVFDFEISVPVTGEVKPAGRVQTGTRPGGRVARTVYQGPYQGLGAAWEEFDRWIVAQGEIPGPSLWEAYLTGPESTPDPSAYRTELSRSLRAKG